MSDIWEFRRMVERLLILFLWINGVVVGVVGFSLSADGAAILSGALLLAAASTLIAWLQPGAAATRHCIGVALMGMVALLAVDAIRAIGATIGRIEQAISTIAHSSERQTAGITSISRTARAAASVVDSVNGDIRQMGSVTEHLATMSSRQTEQASSMASEVEILGEQVEGFVGEVRRG